MHINVDSQTRPQPVAEKMRKLVSVTRKINSCTEIIDTIYEKEFKDRTDSDRQQWDSNIRYRAQLSVDFHSLKKEIVSIEGTNYLKASEGADEVIQCERMTRIRLLVAAETKEKELERRNCVIL